MNWIDYIILGIFIFAGIDGFRKGSIAELLEILSLVIAVLVAYFYLDPISVWLGSQFNLSEGLRPFVAFLGLFWLTDFIFGNIFSLIYTLIDRFIPEQIYSGMISKIIGMFLNWGKQVALTVLTINLILFLPIIPNIRKSVEDSKMASLFVSHHPTLEHAFNKIIEPAVYEAQEFITTTSITDKPIAIDTPVVNLRIDEAAEKEMFNLVNKERKERGLKELQWDNRLMEVARNHSMDMWQRQYFSHIDPDGKDPFDRLRDAGIKYLAAGENLALAPTTPIAHDGLMNSEGHRANILSPDFGKIGIGAIRNGLYGVMFTQMFIN